MRLPPFALERFFAKHEFSARYLLCASDCEALSVAELVSLADDESRLLWGELSLGYTESQGHPRLREAIAKGYTEIEPRDVLTVVPEEGIWLAMNALLSIDDVVVTTYPGYQSLYEVARSIGCRVRRWTPREEDGCWHFSLEDLEARLGDDTRLLVVNFPHNPTGAMPSEDEWVDLLRLARESGVRVFSDEMYRGLEHGGRTPLLPACDVVEGAISLGGLSKAYGLPGLRLGWLATRDGEVLRRCMALKDYTTICGSAPSEILGLMALRAGDKILSRSRRLVADNVVRCEALARRWDQCFRWMQPQGSSVALVRWLGETDVEAMCQRLLKEAGLLLVPGSKLGAEVPSLRFGYGRESCFEALARLDVWLSHNPRL